MVPAGNWLELALPNVLHSCRAGKNPGRSPKFDALDVQEAREGGKTKYIPFTAVGRAKCELDCWISAFSRYPAILGQYFSHKQFLALYNFGEHLAALTATSFQPWPLPESIALSIWLCAIYGCVLSAGQHPCTLLFRLTIKIRNRYLEGGISHFSSSNKHWRSKRNIMQSYRRNNWIIAT